MSSFIYLFLHIAKSIFEFIFLLIYIYIYIYIYIWKSDLTDKMKRSFFQAAVASILLYGCTTWTLTKRLEKKLDGNYTRMLRAILNKSWQQHPTRHQLYGHLPPITKTIQVRRTRHAGHCWRSRDELIRDVLLWIPTHGRAKAGRPARTYIQQLCEDTGCCPEDLPRAMNDREEWRERGRDIRATSVIWWWWWYIYIYINIYTNPSARAGYDTRSILSRVKQVWIQNFSSPRLVASPRLKNPVCLAIQSRPGFELVSPFSFPTTITITPRALPIYIYIYIYIYLSLRKTKTGYIRIINLFPSCYGYWYESITPKKTGLLQI